MTVQMLISSFIEKKGTGTEKPGECFIPIIQGSQFYFQIPGFEMVFSCARLAGTCHTADMACLKSASSRIMRWGHEPLSVP